MPSLPSPPTPCRSPAQLAPLPSTGHATFTHNALPPLPRPATQVTSATSPFAFNRAWVAQMQDEALVAALVALAYPDRLAR